MAGWHVEEVARLHHHLEADDTRATIDLIDVLWLQRNRIEAAFQIEESTSIYTGLLRMADLVALQPNTDIPLFIVAPEERRRAVFREIRRPVFMSCQRRSPAACLGERLRRSFTGLVGSRRDPLNRGLIVSNLFRSAIQQRHSTEREVPE